MPHTKAFTLIELLVVISIIALLAAVVLTSLGAARSKGVDAGFEQQLLSLRNAIELYYSKTGQFPTCPFIANGCDDAFGISNLDTALQPVVQDGDISSIPHFPT